MDFKARGFDVNARHTLVELALLVEEEFNLNAAMASTRAGMAELLDRDAALPSATHIIAYEKIELLVEQAGNAGRKLGIFYLSLDNLYDMSLAYGPGRIQAMINRWMDGLRNHNEDLIYIARLSELGFFIELDDFGTGHSSISSLRDLKVDRVKIDRSFISGVDADPALQKFTSALINLAKSLDISVLAEGVETEAERDWLKRHGCDVIQGFLISKAVPDSDLAMMILKQNFAHPMPALERHGPRDSR